MSEDVVVKPEARSFSFPEAPRLLVITAVLVVMSGLAMTFAGAGRTGVSVDEAGHVHRLEAFIEDGLFVRSRERRGVPEGEIPPNAYVYSPGTARVMHVANALVGNEKLGHPADTAASYTVRHYVVAAMSVVALLAVFGLGWLMVGSWRWGLVASAALAAVPMWTGHAMFNPKDTPVAVGYTLMTFAFAAMAATVRSVGRTRLLQSGAACLGVILGIALMVGTRPGMWPGVVAAVVVVLGLLAAARSLDRWFLLSLVVALAGSYAALLKIYPRIFLHPIAMMKVSMDQSVAFPKGTAPGRGYIFERTAIEWPLLLLAFMLIGTAVGAWLSFRLLATDARRAVAIGLVGAQAFALTAAAIITKSNLYDGLRQLLFAVPAQAALAALGIAVAMILGRNRVMRGLLVALAMAALVLPTIVQARLFPYQYGYGNVAAEVLGADILNDKWQVSFREHVPEIPPTVKAVCPHLPRNNLPLNGRRPDCRASWGVLKPSWLAYWHHARYVPGSPSFYAITRSGVPVAPNCHVVHEAARYRNLERVVMSRLLLCKEVDPAGAAP